MRQLLAQGFDPIDYDIAVLPTAQRIHGGDRLELQLRSADDPAFAIQTITHDEIGLPAINTVYDRSTLTLPLSKLCVGISVNADGPRGVSDGLSFEDHCKCRGPDWRRVG